MESTDEDILMSAPSSPHSSQSKPDDLGDMTFCMANYAKEALKMMHLMRQHHLLTDCVLEVDKELFHGKINFK
jgi:kelch-like protein 19